MQKQQVIDLWKSVFNDSDEFIKLYFDHVYKEENTLTIKKNGCVVSALQILPYKMTYYGEEISVGYISGASTHPSEQGKGLMRKLLDKAFTEMKRRKIAVTALIPAEKWLFDYYKQLGYTSIFDYALERKMRQPDSMIKLKDLSIVSQDKISIEDLFTYFDKKLHQRNICILHSFEDFKVIIEDLRLSEGAIFTVINSNKEIVGMAFTSPITQKNDYSEIYIKEIISENTDVENYLINNILDRNNADTAIIKTPAKNTDETVQLGMAKIIDEDLLIKIWKDSNPKSKISIKDMTEEQRTIHLFDYSHKTAYMSLMLE